MSAKASFRVAVPEKGEVALKAPERTIGAILVQAGRLEPQQAERIAQYAGEKRLLFGEAARALRLATQADIEFALAHLFGHARLSRGESEVSEAVVAAYDPFSPQVEALRAVRGELMLRWLEAKPARKALAILSAAPREGRSFVAANLAVVFAQLGMRTVLVDADLRKSSQHRLFGRDNGVGLSTVLCGRAAAHEALQRIAWLPALSVLPAGPPPPSPQDLIARAAFGELIESLAAQADLILLDSPPFGQAADAQTIAVRAGAALIVLRKNSSRMWRVQGVSASVVQAKTTIVGAVLNDY